ncbi:hypothetical protein C8T65DRAFT_745935 [Cerioporus squamosus]|nr:hypothetical protein C8T65DRAFT_745935 [Cerioporus squamosus]
MLPILLQIALILFLVRLIILLWTLHDTVAAVTSSLVGVLLVFSVAVTLLPAFRWDCSYRSPQALLADALIRAIYNPARAFVPSLLIPTSSLSQSPMPCREVDPTASSAHVNQIIAAIEESLYWMIWERFLEMPTWRGREQLAISAPHTSHELDRDVAIMAYTTTFATTHLKRASSFFSDLGRDQVQLPLQALQFMLSGDPKARNEAWARNTIAAPEVNNAGSATEVNNPTWKYKI